MCVWDSKCVWDIIWLQDSLGFWDIYRKGDDKLLFDGMSIWDSKYVSGIIWLYDSRRFWMFIGKGMVNDQRIACVFRIVGVFGI